MDFLRLPLSALVLALCSMPTAFADYVIEPPDILRIEVKGLSKKNPALEGEYLVRPDGTVSLGFYGTVSVTGLSADEAQAAIAKQVASQVKKKKRGKVEVNVKVSAYNSKVYYIVASRESGDEVHRCSMTGDETVQDAVVEAEKLGANLKGKRIWIARPPKQILTVDWQAITERNETQTNSLLLPGDRVYVRSLPPQ
jgi:polysaccharide export outer membrane protein